jgi:serine-type D-Ala-D-Ala endopeptidase (penicillin-binding protein 7)
MATFLTFGFLRRAGQHMGRALGVLSIAVSMTLVALPQNAQAATQAKSKAVAKKPSAATQPKAQLKATSTKKRQEASAQARGKKEHVAKSARASSVSSAKASSRSAKHGSAQTSGKMQRVVMVGKNGKRLVVMRRAPAVMLVSVPPRLSYGQMAGLHSTQDPLELKSSVAYVLDQDTQEILFQKNENAVLPIASLTKLMTGVIVSEAKLDMNELITIVDADVDTEKGSRSRLRVGTQLTRGQLMLLALMSSENRAAHALGRSYPGGMDRFVQAMNIKAKILGMQDTRYVEPTGLSSRNQSSAKDLATLTIYAANDKSLRELSTSPMQEIDLGDKTINYVNTNRLVNNPEWEIGLQKTGFISEAGQCLIMQAKISGRRLIMVFLDSAGKLSRLGDAERVRRWVESGPAAAQKLSATAHKRVRG